MYESFTDASGVFSLALKVLQTVPADLFWLHFLPGPLCSSGLHAVCHDCPTVSFVLCICAYPSHKLPHAMALGVFISLLLHIAYTCFASRLYVLFIFDTFEQTVVSFT